MPGEMDAPKRPGPTIAAHGEPIHMTVQADVRRTSISRADDGGHIWSPLATHMGYTQTAEQREAILAAIHSMRWIAIRPLHASLLLHIGSAARTLTAALTHAAPVRSAAITSLQSGHTLIGLIDVTGVRHFVIDLRHEAIYVLTAPEAASGEMRGHQRHHCPGPTATPAQSISMRARSTSIRETLNPADPTGLLSNCRTLP